ncbi:MAG: MlaD family protein [Rhodoferax sp.]|nr:MlaD family protein [Rhodoferax sp.]
MENKVNLPLVGAFVLVLAAVLLAGILWLASGGAFRTHYDLYQAMEDESVAGLNLNAPVKYNGVDVGKVRQITLDANNPQHVTLLFEIERGTPIKENTVAILKTQGLTGIAYVELSGGTAESPMLRAVPPNRYPVIQTRPSLAARLENVLTTLLAKLDDTSSGINAFLSEGNRTAFTSAMADIAAVARTVAARNALIDRGIVDAARTLGNSAQASARLDPVLERVGRSADAVEKMGDSVALTSTSAGKTIDTVGADVKRISAQTLPELERLMGELSALSGSLRRLSEQTERDPRGLLFGRKPVPLGPGEVGSAP